MMNSISMGLPKVSGGMRKPAVMFRGNQPSVTMKEVEQLKDKFAELLLGKSASNDFMALYNSSFKINGVGITKVGNDYALSVMTESANGRNALLKEMAKLKGFSKNVQGKPIGGLSKGDALVAIEFNNKPIPVVIRHVGTIRAL